MLGERAGDRTIPGTMCRCWPRKPEALRNGAPFKDWVLPAPSSGAGTSWPGRATATGRSLPSSPPCSPTGCPRWKPPAPMRSARESTPPTSSSTSWPGAGASAPNHHRHPAGSVASTRAGCRPARHTDRHRSGPDRRYAERPGRGAALVRHLGVSGLDNVSGPDAWHPADQLGFDGPTAGVDPRRTFR